MAERDKASSKARVRVKGNAQKNQLIEDIQNLIKQLKNDITTTHEALNNLNESILNFEQSLETDSKNPDNIQNFTILCEATTSYYAKFFNIVIKASNIKADKLLKLGAKSIK